MNTKRKDAHQKFVPGASRGPRSLRTLALQMALEAERQREIGQRIKDLRKGQRKTQPVVAEAVGVTLRAYQEWEAGGGIAWANLEKLATELRTTPEHLLSGPADESGDGSQLDRIESMLAEVLARLSPDPAGEEADRLSREADDEDERGAEAA